MENNYQTISTAYHEAGHAIYALTKFCMVDSVKLSYSKNFAGMTKFFSYFQEVEDNDLSKYFTLANIEINYAGMVSERILYKKISGLNSFPRYLQIGASIDNQSSFKMIKRYNKNYCSNKKEMLNKQNILLTVEDVLQYFWEDVQGLSHFLLKNREAKFKNLKKILKSGKNNTDNYWDDTFKIIEKFYIQNKKQLTEKEVKEALQDYL